MDKEILFYNLLILISKIPISVKPFVTIQNVIKSKSDISTGLIVQREE